MRVCRPQRDHTAHPHEDVRKCAGCAVDLKAVHKLKGKHKDRFVDVVGAGGARHALCGLFNDAVWCLCDLSEEVVECCEQFEEYVEHLRLAAHQQAAVCLRAARSSLFVCVDDRN